MKSSTKSIWKQVALRSLLIAVLHASFSVVYAGGKDSLSSVVVAPGTTHLSIVKDGPYSINVLVVDLHSKDISLETYRPVGLVRTSEQARRNSSDGHRVVAAINADFFSFKTGWPVNNQVRNGEVVYGTQTQRSHFLLDENNRPHIERTSFEGWAKTPKGNTYVIAGVNDAHKDNTIILHNSFSDSATSSTGKGRTVPLALLGSSWAVCDTMRLVVRSEGSVDLAHIPPGSAALWIGPGNATEPAPGDMNTGDTLLVYVGIRPPVKGVRSALGGVGMIIANGKPVSDSVNVEEKTNFNFLTARHPRTFVGFDRDSTKLYLCVVDGRQQQSIGMNFREMAEFLLSIGVWNAVNFDGGGSTTMVVQGKIVNSPSDATGERPVANTLQIIDLRLPSNVR
jgi:hypothetical protein